MSREPASLIILAGGESRRMGFPKHRLQIEGRDVISHLFARLGGCFIETLVAGRTAMRLPTGTRFAEDRYTVRSPLVGIHAGLSESQTDLAFVIACDMPYIQPRLVLDLVSNVRGFDVAVPQVGEYLEPLCAVYRKTCLPSIEKMLSRHELKVSDLYSRVRTHRLTEPWVRRRDRGLASFTNVNVSQGAPLAG